MRLKNILIIVDDVNRSKYFYKKLFGLNILLDNGGNVILTEGLVLQDRTLWEQITGCKTIPENNTSVIYFEERDIEGFADKLELYEKEQEAEHCADRGEVVSIKYVSKLTEVAPGRKVIRFYDPDGNLIEVGTPWR